MNPNWHFPLRFCTGIPVPGHPGAFAAVRRVRLHTGVDLYTNEGEPVEAVEAGVVVAVAPFTGPQDGSPWWLDTDCVLVEGADSVVCYGEVQASVRVGDAVERGQTIARVKRVIRMGRERPDLPGHRPSMLHVELYPMGMHEPSDGFADRLLDPTDRLLESGRLCVPPVLPLRVESRIA